MKLSKSTLEILKNFSRINEGIYVNVGNTVQTISKRKNILAKANVEETFEDEFGIYDLNNFLGILSLYDSPDLDFDGNNIVLKNGNRKTKYRKASKETIMLPPDKPVKMENPEITIDLSANDLAWLIRISSASGSPNIAVSSDGENVNLISYNHKDDAAHVSSTRIADGDGTTYNMIFDTNNLIFVPGNYEVKISSLGVGHFKNKDVDIQYWITTEADSTYGD
jgi:hypothetical protein